MGYGKSNYLLFLGLCKSAKYYELVNSVSTKEILGGRVNFHAASEASLG
jgi:hypothetical protein